MANVTVVSLAGGKWDVQVPAHLTMLPHTINIAVSGATTSLCTLNAYERVSFHILFI